MYLSPEIIKRDRYGTKTDMWSLGVIIFILLGGYPPFCDENRKIQDKLIMKSRYAFFKKYWDVVSNSARELIKSLLVVDPKERLSATEALNHPWFTAKNDSLRRNTLNSRESMAAFFVHGKKKSAFERDTEVIDTIKRLSDIIKAAVIEDNEGADVFSNKEERTEDITDESSIDSENLEPIPLINGVSIGDLNIDYELSRESMTNLKGLSTTVKSSLTQTSLVRSVRWSASPLGATDMDAGCFELYISLFIKCIHMNI
jgi:serine/threonine protein kinase